MKEHRGLFCRQPEGTFTFSRGYYGSGCLRAVFVGNSIEAGLKPLYCYQKINVSHPFFERLNFENIGGTPIVGINANVVIGHGISKRKAIMNMILQTRDVVNANLAQKIKEAI
jgi:glycerol-3-phosphate acyltransferase PlsX